MFLEALYYLVGFPIVGAAATVVPADTGEPGPISTLLYALHPMTPFWNGDMVIEGIDTGISITLTPGGPLWIRRRLCSTAGPWGRFGLWAPRWLPLLFLRRRELR